MTDRHSPLLASRYEVATDAALADAAGRHSARVLPKVRVGDVLEIRGSGITDDEFAYARGAHFDFVIARGEHAMPCFAVEFDGPHHDTDLPTIFRDAKKDSICAKLDFPLLRVDAPYLKQVGTWTLLGWLVDLWFLYDAIRVADAERPFTYHGWTQTNAMGTPQTLELSDNAQRIIYGHHLRGVCDFPGPAVFSHPDPGDRGYAVAVAAIPIESHAVIAGEAVCRNFRFPPISAREVAVELAIIDAASKLDEFYLTRELLDDGQHYPGGRLADLLTADSSRFREIAGNWVREGSLPAIEHLT